jgi:hypothetical protein
MEIKLNKANENIIELVDRLVNIKVTNNAGNCLKIVLFGEDRDNCEDCNACKRKQIRRYREMLLEKYLVK